MEPDANWDIILVGESGVGKTSMILRFVNHSFNAKNSSTVAVDLFTKKIKVHEKDVGLNIWDSAGQEIYRSITPMYFRRAHGCILVYDVTNVTSFNNLSGWLSEFREYHVDAPVIIVGNKSEDPNRKAVALSSVRSYAQQENMEFMECSAKTGTNVEAAFEALFEKMWVHKMALAAQEQTNMSSQDEKSNMHSLAATLSYKSDRNSIILSDFEVDSDKPEQQSNSQSVLQNTPTMNRKRKWWWC